MSIPERPAEPAPPSGGGLLALAFVGLVALGIGGVLAVFAPGWIIVFAVLALSLVAQYFIWGRWLRKAIEAEEAAETELNARDRNGAP